MIRLRAETRLKAVWSPVALAMVGLAACAPPINVAGDTLKGTTTGEAFDGVQCSAVRPQTEPDLMAWDPGSRANLSRLRGAGVVAVRYQAKGCNVELELLSNCIGVGSKYQFSPYSANERKVAHNASELFAQLPIGAAALGADVKGGRALRTDYMLAGQYALPPDATYSASDLRGLDCGRATHVISAIYVGAFVMGAGESRELDTKATLFGAGLHTDNTAGVNVLNTEGDVDACAKAQREGTESFGCAVPLRIGLSALRSPVVFPVTLAQGTAPVSTPSTPERSAPQPAIVPKQASTAPREATSDVSELFTVLGDVVDDPSTGLRWTAKPGRNIGSWVAARDYCSDLDVDGGGWRLPTKRELQALCRRESKLPLRDKTGPLTTDVIQNWDFSRWSSTSVPSDPNSAFFVYNGACTAEQKFGGTEGAIRIGRKNVGGNDSGNSATCVKARPGP